MESGGDCTERVREGHYFCVTPAPYKTMTAAGRDCEARTKFSRTLVPEVVRTESILIPRGLRVAEKNDIKILFTCMLINILRLFSRRTYAPNFRITVSAGTTRQDPEVGSTWRRRVKYYWQRSSMPSIAHNPYCNYTVYVLHFGPFIIDSK